MHGRWGWFALEGVINLAAGAVAFMWPGLTVLVFVIVVGVWALVSGIALLLRAWRLRREARAA